MRTTILLEALAFGGALALPGTDNDHSELVRRGVKGSYIKATAPFENIFADITKKEQKDIVKFLSKQPKKIMYVDISPYALWGCSNLKAELTRHAKPQRDRVLRG